MDELNYKPLVTGDKEKALQAVQWCVGKVSRNLDYRMNGTEKELDPGNSPQKLFQ